MTATKEGETITKGKNIKVTIGGDENDNGDEYRSDNVILR